MKRILVAFILISTIKVAASSQATFPLPAVPDSLRTIETRAAYVAENFWMNADLTNLTNESERSRFEQSFADFISILPIVSDSVKRVAVSNILAKTEGNEKPLSLVLEIAEKYLYYVDSPQKDIETFALFLENIIGDSNINSDLKTRPSFLLSYINKNRVGHTASDFSFESRNGGQLSLYEIESPGNILLMFYDPECDHCLEVMDYMENNELFLDRARRNNISIVAIYSGENKDLWLRTKDSLPSDWMVGYDDGSIENEDIYIIRSMPALYLLDRNKTVLAKEALIENICLIDE